MVAVEHYILPGRRKSGGADSDLPREKRRSLALPAPDRHFDALPRHAELELSPGLTSTSYNAPSLR